MIHTTLCKRRGLILLLIAGVILTGCVTPSAQAVEQPAAAIAFEHHEIITGTDRLQALLTAFLLGGPTADLVLISGERRLRIFTFDGATWAPAVDISLRPEVLFVDVANVGGRDRLITYEHGQVNWFDPDTAEELPLVEITTNYKAAAEEHIPHVDITRDLNHDGHDDLLLPDLDGFWISIQQNNGAFTEATKIGPPEPFLDEIVGNLDTGDDTYSTARRYRDVGITETTLPIYRKRVHEVDYDRDGRNDLVFWNQDRFDVYLQDEIGQFDRLPTSFTPDVLFDADGTYTRAFEFRDQGLMAIIFGLGRKTKRTVLHSIRDLNGDRVADLVTLTLSGRSFAKQRSVYDVHFGEVTSYGIDFAPDAATKIRPKGKAGAMQPWGYASQTFEDFDSDGDVDILFRDVDVKISGMLRAIVGKSVPIILETYRMDGGTYSQKAATRLKIKRFAPLEQGGNVFFPPVLTGDINGDGRADLLVGNSPKELDIFLGVPGPTLFTSRPYTVAVILPYDERNTRLVDINGDSMQDILIYRRSRVASNPVTVLIAR